MNIFFASCSSKLHSDQEIRIVAILDNLKQLGHHVYEYVYDIEKMDDPRPFKELSQQILSADIFIAEMSIPSQTLGFQLSFAYNNTKPTIYMYDESTKGRPDTALSDHPSRLIKIAPYNSSNVRKVLTKSLKTAANQLNSKRTSFMSTYRIDNYINEQSSTTGTPKSEIIRQILNDAVMNDSNK